MRSHVAIPLSNALTLSNTVTRLVVNWNHRHPIKTFKTSIDYDFVVIMMPMCMIGSVVGTVLHSVMAEVGNLIGLTLILVVMATLTIKKALKMRNCS